MLCRLLVSRRRGGRGCAAGCSAGSRGCLRPRLPQLRRRPLFTRANSFDLAAQLAWTRRARFHCSPEPDFFQAWDERGCGLLRIVWSVEREVAKLSEGGAESRSGLLQAALPAQQAVDLSTVLRQPNAEQVRLP